MSADEVPSVAVDAVDTKKPSRRAASFTPALIVIAIAIVISVIGWNRKRKAGLL